MAAGTLTLDNPVMRDFVFYSSVVLLKMGLLTLLTARARLTNKVFANAEDKAGGGKIQFGFEPVERVRRNHLNDLENIVPFILVGAFYVLTNPAPSTALWLFRIFAVSRIIHTVSYQLALPQPSRAFSFMAGFAIIIYMTVRCLVMTL